MSESEGVRQLLGSTAAFLGRARVRSAHPTPLDLQRLGCLLVREETEFWPFGQHPVDP